MNPAPVSEAITAWLQPLRLVLDPSDQVDWGHLTAFATALAEALAENPVSADLPAGPERSRRLLAIRQMLAADHQVDTTQQTALSQVLTQFVCGYRDIDLRDATGLGHGALIARHGSLAARQLWIPRLLAGELAGIACTEPHGGSLPAATRTALQPGRTAPGWSPDARHGSVV